MTVLGSIHWIVPLSESTQQNANLSPPQGRRCFENMRIRRNRKEHHTARGSNGINKRQNFSSSKYVVRTNAVMHQNEMMLQSFQAWNGKNLAITVGYSRKGFNLLYAVQKYEVINPFTSSLN